MLNNCSWCDKRASGYIDVEEGTSYKTEDYLENLRNVSLGQVTQARKYINAHTHKRTPSACSNEGTHTQ